MMNKKLLISFVLSSAWCAPYARAMSGLLPRARQVAAMVMNPSVRTTLAQAGKAGAQELTSMVAPQAERRLMTFTQSSAKPITIPPKPTATQSRSSLAQQCALGIGGVGVAYAIDNNAVVQASDGTYVSLFAKLWAAMVGTAVVEAITYGEQYFPTTAIFLEMVKQNPEYARELAQKVTHENIFELNPELLTEIVKIYPEAKERFAAYLTSNRVQFLNGLNYWWSWQRCRWFSEFCIELMRDNPQVATSLGNFTVEHFEKIVKGYGGSWFIQAMIKNNPALAPLLAGSVVEHFVSVTEQLYGSEVIDEIMKHNPGSIPLITECAVKHWAQLAASGWRGYWAFDHIIKHNPKSVGLFASCLVEHFATLEKTTRGQVFIDNFRDTIRDAEKAALCTPVVAENLALLANSERGADLIKRLMDRNPKSIPIFVESAVKNFDALMVARKGADLITEIVSSSSAKTIMPLSPCIARYAESFIGSDAGLVSLRAIADRCPELITLIAPVAIKNAVTLIEKDNGLRLLGHLMQQDPEVKKELLQKFKESSNQSDVSKSPSLLKEIFYKVMRAEEVTPTELGFIYNVGRGQQSYLHSWMESKLKEETIQNVVNDVIAIEKEYQKTHYTFVHGRNFAYNLREMVYRNLWEYAHNTKVPADFRFTHTKEAHDPLMKDLVIMPEEKKLHERNITVLENYRSEELRNRRLFLNTQLFGNLSVGGSCSFSYFLWNNNASGGIRVSIEDVFGQFGQKELYEKYKERFEALDREHRALTEQGELLIIAVPRERVSEDVQTIQVDGNPAGVKTLDALQARETDPSFKDNELNFTLAMTDTAALDPKSGIKVRSVHAADPVKYAEWQAKYDAIMHELESEFRRNWKRSVNAKQRGHKEFLDVVSEIKKCDAVQQKRNEQTTNEQTNEQTDAGMYSA